MTVICEVEVSSEQYYSCFLTSRIPARVSIMTINGEAGFGIVEALDQNEESIQMYIEELDRSPNTQSVIVTHRSPDAYWTRVVHKVDGPSIYDTILQSGCMTYLPIIVEKGIQTHRVIAPSRDVLSKMLHLLRERFDYVRIKRIRTTPSLSTGPDLTPKQAEAFDLAWQSGYYKMPRTCKIEDLSEKLGIKRVAMQERLRRAEIRIFRDYMGE